MLLSSPHTVFEFPPDRIRVPAKLILEIGSKLGIRIETGKSDRNWKIGSKLETRIETGKSDRNRKSDRNWKIGTELEKGTDILTPTMHYAHVNVAPK